MLANQASILLGVLRRICVLATCAGFFGAGACKLAAVGDGDGKLTASILLCGAAQCTVGFVILHVQKNIDALMDSRVILVCKFFWYACSFVAM